MQVNSIMYIFSSVTSSRQHSYPTPTIMAHFYTLPLVGLLVLALATAALAADSSLTTALNNMKILELLPKQFPIDDSTKTIRIEASNGNEVKAGTHVGSKLISSFEPNKISWTGSGNPEDHFTAIIVDLDRKQKDSNTTTVYNQFLSFNIIDNKLSSGQSLVTYEPPAIQCVPNSKHRILMLVFLQRQYIDIPEVANLASSSGRNSDRRLNFDLKSLLNRYAKKIVAANSFYAQADSSGTCSASTPIKLSPILFLMVIASFAFSCSRKYH